MTSYERGFSDGERQAFNDVVIGRQRRQQPQCQGNDYDRGWWDGYTPRSLQWLLSAKPASARVGVREEA